MPRVLEAALQRALINRRAQDKSYDASEKQCHPWKRMVYSHRGLMRVQIHALAFENQEPVLMCKVRGQSDRAQIPKCRCLGLPFVL